MQLQKRAIFPGHTKLEKPLIIESSRTQAEPKNDGSVLMCSLSEAEEWTENLKTPKIEMSLCNPFSFYMTIPRLPVFTTAETDLMPFSSWPPNSSSSFLSNRKGASNRAGYFSDAFWHGLQLHAELHCLCTWLLKTAEGENGKGSPQSVSHGLMRRRQGLCHSLQEQKTQHCNLSRISALSG